MKNLISITIAIFIGLLINGCGGPVPQSSNNNTMDISSFYIDWDIGSMDYNEGYKCRKYIESYLLAKEAIHRGYQYFALDINILGLPITSAKDLNLYCNPDYHDKSTGLEDDRCGWIRKNILQKKDKLNKYSVHFFKAKNLLVPMWNAQETIKETSDIAHQCVLVSPFEDGVSIDSIRVGK